MDPIYWMANSSNVKPDPGALFTNFVRIFFKPVARKRPANRIHARFIGPRPAASVARPAGRWSKCCS